jgi:hypothetical protein
LPLRAAIYASSVRPEDVLAQTDWSAVEHAYAGQPRVASSPEILAGVLDEDADRQSRAVAELHYRVHHQGNIYSATAPAVLFVVAALDDRRTLISVRRGRGVRAVDLPLRAALLRWLASVMQHAADDYDGRRRGLPVDVEACRAVRPSVFGVARAMRGDPDPSTAAAALGAALASLLDAPQLAHHRAEAATWSADPALARLDIHSRVMAVMTLQTLGADTTPLLHSDPDPVVRAAAALTPAAADSGLATQALLDVLSAPSAGISCTRDYPHFGPIVMSRFLPAAIERASLDDLIPVLDQLLAHAPAAICHGDWGPQLRTKAFPDGFPPAGPLTTTQRALQEMIAERCFGPDSPPLRRGDDARTALIDTVPQDPGGHRT